MRFGLPCRAMLLFGAMDTETRFAIGYDISPDKIGYDATNLFAGAMAPAGKVPDAVTTDALPGFAGGLGSALPGGRRAETTRRRMPAYASGIPTTIPTSASTVPSRTA